MERITDERSFVNRSCDLIDENRSKLHQANVKLHAIRQNMGVSSRSVAVPTFQKPSKLNSTTATAVSRANEQLHKIRSTQPPFPKRDKAAETDWWKNIPTQLDEVTAEPTSTPQNLPNTVRIYPTLAITFQQRKMCNLGRLWLLAHALDHKGQGWIDVAEFRKRFTTNPSYICGDRRMRQLLNEGDGQMWTISNGRMWLTGAYKLARLLEIERFDGKPVELPISQLTGKLAVVRATFYAVFHAGRKSQPIARATIEQILDVPERTQRAYDKIVRVQTKANYGIAHEQKNGQFDHEYGWQHGRASFTWHDKAGVIGQAGKRYHARRLPNSYTTTFEQTTSGKQRMMNKQLRQDLDNQRDQGNSRAYYHRQYYTDAKQANKAIQQANPIYWRPELAPRHYVGLWMSYQR